MTSASFDRLLGGTPLLLFVVFVGITSPLLVMVGAGHPMVGGLQGQPGGLELGRYVAFPGMYAQDFFFTISTERQEVDALPEIFQLKGKSETPPKYKNGVL